MPVERSAIIALLKRVHLFRGVDEQKLDAAISLMEQVDLPAASAIFQQGDDPDYFYIILNGRVRITRYNREEQQFLQLGFMEEDDYFGEEMLESNWPRQISTETATDATLIRISVPNFITLLEQIPTLSPRLQFILDSYRLMLNTHFAWHDPEETIYFIARKHVAFLWLRILPPTISGIIFIPLFLFLYLRTPLSVTMLALLVLVTLATIVWWIWEYVDWTNDYYIITNRRVIYQERVVLLYDSRQESPIEAVQSTSTNTTQMGRWLGYGNVAIRTYIGTILFRSVNNPGQIMAMMQEQQSRAQSSQRRAELRAMESTIERKIGAVPPPPAPPKMPTPPPITPFQRFISDLLHLRYEIGGTILYRTHWFILLGKIWAPSLLLLALLLINFARLLNKFVILSMLATCGLTSFAGLTVFLWWLYQYIDWHNDIYLITPDQVVDVYKKPLGRENRQAAPLKNILSIEYKRMGLIGLILNYGTVFIRVGDQTLAFDDVFNPAEVQRELFHRLAAKNFAERQATAEGERQRMADWIAAYHRVAQRSQPPRTPPPTRPGF